MSSHTRRNRNARCRPIALNDSAARRLQTVADGYRIRQIRKTRGSRVTKFVIVLRISVPIFLSAIDKRNTGCSLTMVHFTERNDRVPFHMYSSTVYSESNRPRFRSTLFRCWAFPDLPSGCRNLIVRNRTKLPGIHVIHSHREAIAVFLYTHHLHIIVLERADLRSVEILEMTRVPFGRRIFTRWVDRLFRACLVYRVILGV